MLFTFFELAHFLFTPIFIGVLGYVWVCVIIARDLDTLSPDRNILLICMPCIGVLAYVCIHVCMSAFMYVCVYLCICCVITSLPAHCVQKGLLLYIVSSEKYSICASLRYYCEWTLWVFPSQSTVTDTGGLQTTHTVDLCSISGYYYLSALTRHRHCRPM